MQLFQCRFPMIIKCRISFNVFDEWGLVLEDESQLNRLMQWLDGKILFYQGLNI